MRAMMFVVSLILFSSFGIALAPPADIVIDGKFDDWESVKGYSDDEGDTFGGPEDATMDIISYRIANDDDFLYVTVTVKEDISEGRTSRGAYQTVVDTDNDYDTGIQSDTEAPYPPHEQPMGVDRYISLETDTGQVLGVGMAGFEEDADEIAGPGEFELLQAFCEVEVLDNRYELSTDLKSLDIELESEIRVTILHYSAVDTVDWTMPAITYLVTLQRPGAVDARGSSLVTWGSLKSEY